jgi:hypothetical protein
MWRVVASLAILPTPTCTKYTPALAGDRGAAACVGDGCAC